MGSLRPADECPFGRPLPESFDACPTFHPVRFVPLTATFQPLRPVLTCRHMEAGTRADTTGTAYYCRCAVGDAAGRKRMAARLGDRRAVLMREVADALMGVVVENWETLGAVKGRELGARATAERFAAQREVAAAAADLINQMTGLVDGRLRAHLRELGIARDALVAVIEAGVLDFEAHGFAAWAPPDHLLAALPDDVAAFLRPGAPAGVAAGG